MKIKTTVKYYHTSSKMVKSKRIYPVIANVVTTWNSRIWLMGM